MADTPTPPVDGGITDEAVEIAARAEMDATWQGEVDWDSLDHDTRQSSLTAMRAALAAALPYLTADRDTEHVHTEDCAHRLSAMDIPGVYECDHCGVHHGWTEWCTFQCDVARDEFRRRADRDNELAALRAEVERLPVDQNAEIADLREALRLARGEADTAWAASDTRADNARDQQHRDCVIDLGALLGIGTVPDDQPLTDIWQARLDMVRTEIARLHAELSRTSAALWAARAPLERAVDKDSQIHAHDAEDALAEADRTLITVEQTAPGRWAVRRGARCLSVTGDWVYEPIPSSRTDEWLAEHRFSKGLALQLAESEAPDVVVNGHRAGTVAQPQTAASTPCPYTHSHTRDWCGRPSCRES